MNKRIRLLAEQATTRIEPTATSGEGWIFDKEKFAQLIVRECADFIDAHKRVDEYGLACDIVYGEDLMKHLGFGK
jgi:hypothetical protein